MESFINLAKEGFEKYQESQAAQHSQTGSTQHNASGYSYGGEIPIDHEQVVQKASQHGSGDSAMFSEAMNYVSNNKHQHTVPVDEEAATAAHRQAYSEGSASNMHASSLGSAAALQVLKQFTSHGSSGGGSKSELISLAMAEASKLFESSGGGSGGSKQDAVKGAAMTVMKLLVQSKSSSTTGGGNSGGLSSLMGLASKFL